MLQMGRSADPQDTLSLLNANLMTISKASKASKANSKALETHRHTSF